MSKFVCSYSGIQCEVSHLPISICTPEMVHPIFYLPQQKYLGLISKYNMGELPNQIDQYLLYLGLFESTGLVEFRLPASFDSQKTPQIIANNINDLCSVVFKIAAIKTPAFQCPKFVISQDTKTLENSHHWISAWEQSIKSFLDGNKRQRIQEELHSIEERIYKHILNPNVKPQKYATSLAIWAARAANFPEFGVNTDFGYMSLSQYWQLIIRKCVSDRAMFDIPSEDIEELIDHCESNLELGTMYSHSLLNLLRDGRERHVSYLGLGSLDLDTDTPYQILDEAATNSVEVAAIVAAIKTTPKSEPQREHYPSEFEYQKARIKFQIFHKGN